MLAERKIKEEDLYKEGMRGMIPTIDMIATGRNIIRLREAAGLSVRELQDIFGFATPQAIYKWQHGTALPSIDNLVVLDPYCRFRLMILSC